MGKNFFISEFSDLAGFWDVGGLDIAVLLVPGARSNERMRWRRRSVFGDKALQKIIRRGTGVIFRGCHIATLKENQ
jgi:hypothetical protein